jgi:hypothetical protein
MPNIASRKLVTSMQVEHRITVQTRPEVVFRIYEDVANWHKWDPDTRKASLDGSLRKGARGKLTPTKGNSVPMLVTEMVDGRSFTVESKIPLFRMLFEHVLDPVGTGTEVVHRVTFSGPLSIILGPLLARQLNAGLPVTLRNLKQLAEGRGNSRDASAPGTTGAC